MNNNIQTSLFTFFYQYKITPHGHASTTITIWQFFLLGDWFFMLVNKLTVSLLTNMLALELVWKLTLEKLFFYLLFGKQYLKYVKSAARK